MSAVAAPQTLTTSRDRLLDVAEELFARRGFAGVGMRELADAAGLGKSSVFHHFRGKVGLYSEALHRVISRIHDNIVPVMVSEGPVVDRIDRVIDTLIDTLVEKPPTARFLLRALFEDEQLPPDAAEVPEHIAAEAVLESVLTHFHTLIHEGVKNGSLRPVSAAHTIQTLIGSIAYHFASGEFGEQLLGRPLASARGVEDRKRELKELMHHGIVAS